MWKGEILCFADESTYLSTGSSGDFVGGNGKES